MPDITMDTSGLSFPDLDHERIVMAGARVVLDGSKTRTPYAPKDATDHEPHLRDTARIDPGRGGESTVGVVYDSVYAAYIHENLTFAHPHGGQAKYLEAALVEDRSKAISAMAEEVLR